MDCKDRLQVAQHIYSKLETFGLLNSSYDAIVSFKKILNEYVRGAVHNDLLYTQKVIQGKIPFPEANKILVYRLPLTHREIPKVVLEHKYFG